MNDRYIKTSLIKIFLKKTVFNCEESHTGSYSLFDTNGEK